MLAVLECMWDRVSNQTYKLENCVKLKHTSAATEQPAATIPSQQCIQRTGHNDTAQFQHNLSVSTSWQHNLIFTFFFRGTVAQTL